MPPTTINCSAKEGDVQKRLAEGQLDLHAAKVIQIRTDQLNGRFRLWVNVDGTCVLRAWSMEDIKIDLAGPHTTGGPHA